MKVKVSYSIPTTEIIEVDEKFRLLETWDRCSEEYYDLVDEFMDMIYDKFGSIDMTISFINAKKEVGKNEN